MQKGQISLDFLITILVATIALSGLGLITISIQETQEEILLTNQLKQTANELSSTITAAQVMQDTNFYSKIKIDNLIYKNNKFFPIITIDSNKLTISENISGKDLNFTKTFYKPAKIIAETNGSYLVIRNV